MLISSTGTLVRTRWPTSRWWAQHPGRAPDPSRRGRAPPGRPRSASRPAARSAEPRRRGRRGRQRDAGSGAESSPGRPKRRPVSLRSQRNRSLRARIQFCCGARDAAPGGPRAGPGRADRLAAAAACRCMEMSHRGKRLHGGGRGGRGGSARAARGAEPLPGAVPAGRRHRAVRRGAAESGARRLSSVDYVNTGPWSKKALGEAERYCHGATWRRMRPHRTTPPCRRRATGS